MAYSKQELIELSGQVINGMMSADSSIWMKILDRADHSQIASTAVDIAKTMLDKIESVLKEGKTQVTLSTVMQYDDTGDLVPTIADKQNAGFFEGQKVTVTITAD